MTHHDEAPVPGYDGLTAGDIEHRIRSLGPAELTALLDYERRHANRAGVIQLITARQAELDAGSTPSPGGEVPPAPGGPTRGTSPVDPATSPQPFSAPPHGTPHQSGKPKGNERTP
ncbi:hypothetical protein [Streptomyces litchfieldiae]|uniref:DUF8129 domain-containing protein n=1 Tax=Streptomyces litchfieldiae TaxID=3075543 RepID=A0ABU2MXJ7_9ACTN|nr:hypothetical protein [Streptomyces sp. DSM 44938]MDT0346367.1 hypothetical protein [Streptomyces sp. DSM 44938]